MITERVVRTPLRLSVSSWSLRRFLGDPASYGPGQGIPAGEQESRRHRELLLRLPERLAAFGLHTVEICHFHVPSLEPGYLAELRSALEASDIELFSLLIDRGDITHPDHAERDLQWIESWLDVAGQLGARRSRVIAGMAEATPETLEMSLRGLRRLIARAEEQHIRLTTENWYPLLARPLALRTVWERLEGKLGLCFDFGNWSGPTKYADLEQIADLAESCHAKAHFSPAGDLDLDDYKRCLDITAAAGFSGPYTLIYAGADDDEWAGLNQERQVVSSYLAH